MTVQSYLRPIPGENYNLKRYIPMFTAALFTIAKTWKQPKCPSTDEWIKMWYTHTHIYIHTQIHTQNYSIIKKNEIMSFAATRLNLEIIILSKWNKDKYDVTLYVNLTNYAKELIYKTEKRLKAIKKKIITYGYQRGKGNRDKLGVWD